MLRKTSYFNSNKSRAKTLPNSQAWDVVLFKVRGIVKQKIGPPELVSGFKASPFWNLIFLPFARDSVSFLGEMFLLTCLKVFSQLRISSTRYCLDGVILITMKNI